MLFTAPKGKKMPSKNI